MKKTYSTDLEIYPQNLLLEAIDAFWEVTEITLDNIWNLIIHWDSQEEINEIFNEFMNYNISLINE